MIKFEDEDTAPDILTADGAEIWKESVGLLPNHGTPQELELLEAFCATKARLIEAEGYLRESGLVVILRTDKGEPKSVVEAPQVKIAERCRDTLLELSRKLKLKG